MQWHLAQPLVALAGTLPPFQFEVKKVPHPDSYWTGASLALYSGRLITFLSGLGISYETFDAEIRERKSSARVLEDYRVFRLLETYSLIDVDRSDMITRPYSLFIDEQAEKDATPMFMDENFRYLVFVSEEIKRSLEEHKFTGLRFLTLKQYLQHG